MEALTLVVSGLSAPFFVEKFVVLIYNACGGKYMKYTSASVRQTKTGKWQARLRYKEGEKWKNLDKVLPEAKGKREAQRMAEDFRRQMNEIAEHEQIPEMKRTVDEVVMGYLNRQFTTGQLERSTYNTQVTAYNKNIKPYLGDIIFDTLDRTSIVNWHTTLSNQGLSQHSIYYTYTIITKVYNYFVEIGELNRNPFHTVKGLNKSKVNRVTHLDQKQMEKFVVSAYLEFDVGSAMLAGVMLAYYGGLRRGEICGLRWNDVDFERRLINISSAVGMAKGGAYTKGPKNKSSIRTFPMIPQLQKVLQERYDMIKPKQNWFVIGEEEQFMAPHTFNHNFKRFIDAYDLVDAYGKAITPHSLRHNLATVGMRSNMDIAALSMMMGHASRSMTLDIYGDANEQSKQIAAKRLSATFKKESDLDE
jgi:integrase